MRAIYVDVRHQEMLERPLFGGKLTSPEALQNYVRARWPVATAKAVAREWSLTLDEAKGIVAGRASRATMDKAFERGGWPVALCVVAGVIGQHVGEFFAAESQRAADAAEQSRRDAEQFAAAEQAARTAVVHLLNPAAAGARPPVAPRRDRLDADRAQAGVREA